MKKIIPFTKEITFKTTVEEITSISLDHDLQLKGEDAIAGNFFVKGKFKMTKASQIEEDFSYKIPCEIAISDEYDTYDAIIDIDDFYYDLLDSEILKINIAVVIDNLVKKEKVEEKQKLNNPLEEIAKQEEIRVEATDNIMNNIILEYEKQEERIDPLNVISETKKELFTDNSNDTYSTYYVYLVKEGDSFDTITNKYNITKDDILIYNDITEVLPGIKLIIPESNNG